MKFCPECGSKNEGYKFCSNCGFEVKNNNPETNLENYILPPFSNSLRQSSDTGLKNNSSLKLFTEYFEESNSKYFGNKIPDKDLKRLIRNFDFKRLDFIKRLEHFFFYSEQSSNAIGGWDVGFSLSIFKNRIYLCLASGEKMLRIVPTPVTTTTVKNNVYEIYDLENKTSFLEISIDRDKLLVTRISNNESYIHSINGSRVYYELVDFCKDIQKGKIIKLPSGIIISETEWKSINSLSTGEKVSNTIEKIIVFFGGVIIFFLLLSAILSKC